MPDQQPLVLNISHRQTCTHLHLNQQRTYLIQPINVDRLPLMSRPDHEPVDIARLIEQLTGEPPLRQAARTRLLELGPAAVPELIATLNAGTGREAWAAITVLSEMADPQALPALLDALNSPNNLISSVAVEALLRYHGRTAVDLVQVLLAALPAAPPMTGQSIILVLQRMGDQRAVPGLADLLRQTDSHVIRYAIIRALGELGDPSVIPLIRSYADDDNHHVREWVVVALRQLGAG